MMTEPVNNPDERWEPVDDTENLQEVLTEYLKAQK